MQDIVAGLERHDWRLVGTPEYDEKHKEWKYTIETVDLEGEELHVRIAVSLERFSFTVVTKW